MGAESVTIPSVVIGTLNHKLNSPIRRMISSLIAW